MHAGVCCGTVKPCKAVVLVTIGVHSEDLTPAGFEISTCSCFLLFHVWAAMPCCDILLRAKSFPPRVIGELADTVPVKCPCCRLPVLCHRRRCHGLRLFCMRRMRTIWCRFQSTSALVHCSSKSLCLFALSPLCPAGKWSCLAILFTLQL